MSRLGIAAGAAGLAFAAVVLRVTARPQAAGPGKDDARAHAVEAKLIGGGDLRFRLREGALYLTVNGPARGFPSLCIGNSREVSILHASAALGTARYRRSGESWARLNGFEWKVRDSPQSGPASSGERQGFLEQNGWVANSSHQGEPSREFQIELLPEREYIGIAFLSVETMSVSYWPATMADDCRALDLLKGDPP